MGFSVFIYFYFHFRCIVYIFFFAITLRNWQISLLQYKAPLKISVQQTYTYFGQISRFKLRWWYDGVRRVSGLRREPLVSVKNPTLIPHPNEKDDPDPVVAESDPLVASSVRVFCARNSQREGRSLPRQGRDHLFQWDVGISVGFFTETTGSLRNPETRRTPSYIYFNDRCWCSIFKLRGRKTQPINFHPNSKLNAPHTVLVNINYPMKHSVVAISIKYIFLMCLSKDARL